MIPLTATFTYLLASGVPISVQMSRLLKLYFLETSRIPENALLPLRLHGKENLFKNCRYELGYLSSDTHLEFKTFIGQTVEISLLLPDGLYRLLAGLVTVSQQFGLEGSFPCCRLTIGQTLTTLDYYGNSHIFQNRIVISIFYEHLYGSPVFTGISKYRHDLIQDYLVLSLRLQHRESDLVGVAGRDKLDNAAQAPISSILGNERCRQTDVCRQCSRRRGGRAFSSTQTSHTARYPPTLCSTQSERRVKLPVGAARGWKNRCRYVAAAQGRWDAG